MVGQARRLKGSKIVRFFVYVHDFWLYLLHNPSQFRIGVQVVVTIAGHRGNDHAVPCDVELF